MAVHGNYSGTLQGYLGVIANRGDPLPFLISRFILGCHHDTMGDSALAHNKVH